MRLFRRSATEIEVVAEHSTAFARTTGDASQRRITTNAE
jgi:hypothetical protein